MEKKYSIKPSWNINGWWAVCYLNAVETPTLFCEAPNLKTAERLAELLNEDFNLHQAGEQARQRLASFDRLLVEMETLANKMRLEDAARLMEAK